MLARLDNWIVLFCKRFVIAAGFAMLDRNIVFCENNVGANVPNKALVGTLNPGNMKFVL